MQRLLYLFFGFLILSSCSKECEEEYPDFVWVQKIDSPEITRVVIRVSTHMDRTWRLKLEDSRVYYSDYLEKIRLVYSTMNILDIEQSRRLIVDLVEEMLRALNHDPIIRADMYREPFQPEDLEIYISLESYFGQYVDPFMVGWIEVDEGIVTYYMNSLKDYQNDNWHYRSEPYYKALEIVRAEDEADLIYPKVERNFDRSGLNNIEGEFIDIPQRKNTPQRTISPKGSLSKKSEVQSPKAEPSIVETPK